jgi:hypothetical protein
VWYHLVRGVMVTVMWTRLVIPVSKLSDGNCIVPVSTRCDGNCNVPVSTRCDGNCNVDLAFGTG